MLVGTIREKKYGGFPLPSHHSVTDIQVALTMPVNIQTQPSLIACIALYCTDIARAASIIMNTSLPTRTPTRFMPLIFQLEASPLDLDLVLVAIAVLPV